MLKRIIFDIDNNLMGFPKDYYIYFNLAINSSVNYLLPGLIPRGSAS